MRSVSKIDHRKKNNVVGLLKSWQQGYISPSAQQAIKDGIDYIEELCEYIYELERDIERIKSGKRTLDIEDIEF